MKTTTITDLLSWAFIYEIPKIQRTGNPMTAAMSSAWSSISRFGELGTLVDRTPNAHGIIPSFVDEGDPHPDALLVADAVKELHEVRFDIPEGWNPFPEFEDPYGLIAAEVAAVVAEVQAKGDLLAGRHIVSLVTTSAILKRGPDWYAEQPTFPMVSRNGRPLWFIMKKVRTSTGKTVEQEVDGMDRSRGRPLPGAYRKYELGDPIRGDVLSRLEWQLWQDALAVLHQAVVGRLAQHELYEFRPLRQPWIRQTATI